MVYRSTTLHSKTNCNITSSTDFTFQPPWQLQTECGRVIWHVNNLSGRCMFRMHKAQAAMIVADFHITEVKQRLGMNTCLSVMQLMDYSR